MNHRPANSMCFIILIGFLNALQPGSAQTAAPLKTDVPKEKLVAALERTIPDLMKKANIPGLSISQGLVQAAIGGDKELGIACLEYEQYDSPGTRFFKAVLDKGAEEKLKELEKKQ